VGRVEEDKIAELRQEKERLEAEIRILKQALAEAGEFAMKRLPHDARETNATSEYFQVMFMENAREKLYPRGAG